MLKKVILSSLVALTLGSVLLEARAYRPNNPSLSVDRPYRPGSFDKNNYYTNQRCAHLPYGSLAYYICMATKPGL